MATISPTIAGGEFRIALTPTIKQSDFPMSKYTLKKLITIRCNHIYEDTFGVAKYVFGRKIDKIKFLCFNVEKLGINSIAHGDGSWTFDQNLVLEMKDIEAGSEEEAKKDFMRFFNKVSLIGYEYKGSKWIA